MISIVIPVLNEEKLLPNCLRSLQEQDYDGDYEILVVDNGSTDRSVEITRQSGASVVFAPTKHNVFAARDYGARQAHGDLIAQADADTVYPRDWLARIARHFARSPNVVAVTGTFAYSDPARWGGTESALRNLGNFFTTKILGRPYIISGANFAFRRQAFLKTEGYDTGSFGADQMGIASRLSKYGKVIYDRHLTVFTSPRRFQKSTFRLIRDAASNISRGWILFWQDFFSESAPKRSVALKTMAKVMPIIVVGAFLSYGYFDPGSTVFGKVYSKAKTSEKIVALTFDDGPNEPYTSQVLDILDRYGIKATFFVTGKNVETYPEVARRMLAEGDVVGNHSYSHNANHALTDQGIKDMDRAEQVIFDILGVRPRLYRPPHGKKSPWELRHLSKENEIEVNWNVSASELRGKSADWIAKQIVGKTRPGSIIALHDGYGNEHGTTRADKSITVQTLPLIINSLLEQGYSFVTVPELLGQPAYD